MDTELARGRRILIAFIAIVILMDGAYAVRNSLAEVADREEVMAQARGVVLLGAVLYWLYRGSRFAKGILVGLLGLAGLASLMMASYDPDLEAVVLPGSPDPAEALFGVVMLTFVGVLSRSRSVNAFLAHQRARASGGA